METSCKREKRKKEEGEGRDERVESTADSSHRRVCLGFGYA
jgi:hypothetical protein